MDENDGSTARGIDPDTAPDLSRDGWPEKFAKTPVRRGRPPKARPKVSTTIRLSQEVIDHFALEAGAGRRGSTTPYATGSSSTTLPEVGPAAGMTSKILGEAVSS